MLNFLRVILSPLTIVYGFLIECRNYFFDKKIFKSKKVNAKVISIGNITVGGSGKTPTVIYVTNVLKDAGKKVGILSRGYMRNSKGYLLVSDGKKVLADVNKSGDETFLVAEECNVPAAVAERRVDGANKFLNDIKLDTIVLDDAYQHRWIERDLNILIFDQRFMQKTESMDQKLMPLGIMREPFSAVDRADIIIINRKFNEKKVIPDKLQKYFKGKKIFTGYYEAAGIYDVKSHQNFELKEFKGQKSLVVCGIARPFSFLKVLENNGIDFTNKLLFADHKNYTNKEVETIRKKFYSSNAHSVLTTQKDAVKLTRYSKELDDIDIYYLKIDLIIEQKDEFKNHLLEIYK